MPRGHRRLSPSNVSVLVGRRIRELREERGIGQAELARRIVTSASHLNKVESGLKAPTVLTLEAVARGLGVELQALFPVRGERPAKKNPPDPLWAKISGDLRELDHDYLILVRDMLKVLDRATAPS